MPVQVVAPVPVGRAVPTKDDHVRLGVLLGTFQERAAGAPLVVFPVGVVTVRRSADTARVLEPVASGPFIMGWFHMAFCGLLPELRSPWPQEKLPKPQFTLPTERRLLMQPTPVALVAGV